MALDLEALCSPLTGDRPGGDAPDPVAVEKIRDARKEDDPTLPQGKWETTLRRADWLKVIETASTILSKQSKDLQVAGWLTEACTARYGFKGANDGLRLIATMLERHWEHLHPEIEDGDLDPRAAKLEWLDANVAERMRKIPLTAEPEEFGLARWLEAKDTDHRIGQKADLAEQLIAEGRITRQIFEQSIERLANDAVLELKTEIATTLEAVEALAQVISDKFGKHAPTLRDVPAVLAQCAEVIDRVAAKKGLLRGAAAAEGAMDTSNEGPSGAAVKAIGSAQGQLANKAAALSQLDQIADFFRKTEPHSPVAFLITQAVRWANTPLDLWLAEVVKDEGSLLRIREMLGIRLENG